MTDSQMILSAIVLRAAQVTIQAAPTLVIGLAVAGVMRNMMGTVLVREWFGGTSWRAIFCSWLAGMLLPVCSFGALPIMREMRRAGVSGGSLLAFGLTAPLFNPASVLYGLTLSSPTIILTFAFCSLVLVTAVGMSWDFLFSKSSQGSSMPPEILDEQLPSPGIRRILSIPIYMGRELMGWGSMYLLAGVTGVCSLSLLLPNGSLQNAAEHQDPWAPLFMVLLSALAYLTPINAIVNVAGMFEHGNSAGAAMALLMAGAGLQLGTICWIGVSYGWRRCLVWLTLFFILAAGLAYCVDQPLYPHGIEAAGHTHAFDPFCFPFTDPASASWARITAQLEREMLPHELVGLVCLFGLLLVGLGVQVFDRQGRSERWTQAGATVLPSYDRIVPKHVLGGILVAGLLALSVVGCFIYYPPPSEVLNEMREVNIRIGSAALSKDWIVVKHWIPAGEDWAHKMTVSCYMRNQPPSKFQEVRKKIYLDKLERLEHAAENKDSEKARQLGLDVQNAFRRLRAAHEPNVSRIVPGGT